MGHSGDAFGRAPTKEGCRPGPATARAGARFTGNWTDNFLEDPSGNNQRQGTPLYGVGRKGFSSLEPPSAPTDPQKISVAAPPFALATDPVASGRGPWKPMVSQGQRPGPINTESHKGAVASDLSGTRCRQR